MSRRGSADETAITPDGSPVVVYRRLKAADEPDIVAGVVPPPASLLELGSGAGRLTHALVALGYNVLAVDESPDMLRWIEGAQTVRAKIEGLSLGRQFNVVLMASYLVNTADDDQRRAFLDTARRHLAPDGVVLLQHHPADWPQIAEESSTERDGVRLSLTSVKVDVPYVSAVMVFEVDGHIFRQPFTARIFDRAGLASELEQTGLQLREQLSERWSVAQAAERLISRPSGGRAR